MKIKRLALAGLVCLVMSTIATILWAGNRAQRAPDVFASAGGTLEKERVLFNVNPTGTTQSTSWTVSKTSYEKLVESVKAQCPASSGWFHYESERSFEVGRRSGLKAVMVQRREDGTLQVSIHGVASKADYWAEWIRTRGQVRVYDPMNIGLFRKPGPIPTAGKVP